MRHGKGFYKWDDQSAYEGEWHKDKMHGYGIYANQEGNMVEGMFEYDSFVGVEN
jgi:hypothetical protein